MLRWLEELEIRYSDFLRLILSFKHSKESWMVNAESSADLGVGSFCRRQASVYDSLYRDALKKFRNTASLDVLGEGLVLEDLNHKELVNRLAAHREKSLAHVRDNLDSIKKKKSKQFKSIINTDVHVVNPHRQSSSNLYTNPFAIPSRSSHTYVTQRSLTRHFVWIRLNSIDLDDR